VVFVENVKGGLENVFEDSPFVEKSLSFK